MRHKIQRRKLFLPVFHIDTNLINARQKLPEVNQLERWFENEVILINMSGVARKEALAGSKAARTRKANAQIFTVHQPTNESDNLFQRVAQILFPDTTLTTNQCNDVKIVCDAVKMAAILVTNDGASRSQPGGILGNKDALASIVKILNPKEAVGLVRQHIRERDDYNRYISDKYAAELPPWTGED